MVEGKADGTELLDGMSVGVTEGKKLPDGDSDGLALGKRLGLVVGSEDGESLGSKVEGLVDGMREGMSVKLADGLLVRKLGCGGVPPDGFKASEVGAAEGVSNGILVCTSSQSRHSHVAKVG